MSNLFNTYKEETKKELVVVYAKSCILKEYMHILPIVSKLSVDEVFKNTISQKIISNYYLDIKNYISLPDFTEIVMDSLVKIFARGSSVHDEVLIFREDFLKTFITYDVESGNQIGNRIESKYKDNNLYVERFFYLENQNFNLITNNAFNDLKNDKKYQGAVSLGNMKIFLNSIRNLNNSVLNDIFDILPEFKYGVRLMYNPVVNFQNKKQKYNLISSKNIPSREKINAIYYKENRNEEFYFPIKLSEVRYNLYSLLSQKNYQNFSQLIYNFDGIFELTKKTLWDDPNFKNLFMYHIPVQIIYPILFDNISNKYSLLKQVFDKELPYVNLNEIIINIIEGIENAEDPNRL